VFGFAALLGRSRDRWPFRWSPFGAPVCGPGVRATPQNLAERPPLRLRTGRLRSGRCRPIPASRWSIRPLRAAKSNRPNDRRATQPRAAAPGCWTRGSIIFIVLYLSVVADPLDRSNDVLTGTNQHPGPARHFRSVIGFWGGGARKRGSRTAQRGLGEVVGRVRGASGTAFEILSASNRRFSAPAFSPRAQNAVAGGAADVGFEHFQFRLSDRAPPDAPRGRGASPPVRCGRAGRDVPRKIRERSGPSGSAEHGLFNLLLRGLRIRKGGRFSVATGFRIRAADLPRTAVAALAPLVASRVLVFSPPTAPRDIRFRTGRRQADAEVERAGRTLPTPPNSPISAVARRIRAQTRRRVDPNAVRAASASVSAMASRHPAATRRSCCLDGGERFVSLRCGNFRDALVQTPPPGGN